MCETALKLAQCLVGVLWGLWMHFRWLGDWICKRMAGMTFSTWLPAPSPRNSLNSHRGGAGGAGGMTPRMTPRVPNSGDVAPKMTPRMPLGSNQSGRNGSSTARGSENIVIRPEQVATLSRDTLRFLTKKLVHLTVLLEQDTVSEDVSYPKFAA